MYNQNFEREGEGKEKSLIKAGIYELIQVRLGQV